MTDASTPLLRCDDGRVLRLMIDRWHDEPDPEDLQVLDDVIAPVLDVGCGPGRHTLALALRGLVTLGIDAAPAAVKHARATGAPVLHRSVFGRVPAEGRWATALLLDGNIGIGGDPRALLGRIRSLLAPGGRVLVELEPPPLRIDVLTTRVERGGAAGPWFRWARVGVDGISGLAAGAGLLLSDVTKRGERWFATLSSP